MNRREILRYTAYATGFAVSAPLASVFLTSCKADPEMMAPTFKPSFFTDAEYEYVAKMANAMLPSDGTPGALDVGVPQLVDQMYAEVLNAENQQKTRAGLAELMKKMDADNPGGFSKLDDDKALMYLQDQDLHYKSVKDPVQTTGQGLPSLTADEEAAATAKAAYFSLKSMIISTYFRTEEVAKTLLVYDPVPGEYIPCGDLQELTGGKSWAI
ncbi:gluconate 2-dehydrogenase subunit 3 family protein [Neolewinella lacunae]|uniref:Gluconate 2-dehydrogenase subunit 3 family protein n=1 Tax=Neolewinella lacunae TaxID=1517758 RepID=A0A923T8X2_9BACT|nr:gluconate 2-dehydrogenase subunit 3 family protein [Neolewinella lacunae]MBC6995004.1 gluconate 2-dehydrogenase subunit 3 family protein [Neolewinella lacunae]MDN3633225.1 gluconate 2-dehydrogenase subunit 3 family protein [Neolewinella lacunae]